MEDIEDVARRAWYAAVEAVDDEADAAASADYTRLQLLNQSQQLYYHQAADQDSSEESEWEDDNRNEYEAANQSAHEYQYDNSAFRGMLSPRTLCAS